MPNLEVNLPYPDCMSGITSLDLSSEILERMAGEDVYERGEKLLDAVTLTVNKPKLVSAVVRGTHPYQVDIELAGTEARATCTCPHFYDGNFCKHLVAVGLVAGGASNADPGISFDDVELDTVSGFLDAADKGELIAMMENARATIPAFEDYLQQRAMSEAGSDEAIETHVKEVITAACRVGSFVDYRRSAEVADQLDEAVVLVAGYLQDGRSKALVKQSRRLVERIAKILERADDSGGAIGIVLDMAVALHTQVCLDAAPDPGKLVDWILKIQISGPGWPDLNIGDYWEILDERSIKKYRRTLEVALENQPETGGYMIRHYLINLSDATGDTDESVRLLMAAGNFVEALSRLDDAGRPEEAHTVFMRIVNEWTGRGGRSLGVPQIVDRLLANNLVDDAYSFAEKALSQRPDFENYQALLRVGGHQKQDLRDQAREIVSTAAQQSGWPAAHARSVLIEIAIDDDDAEKVWSLANGEIPGGFSNTAASYFKTKDPEKAVELYVSAARKAVAGGADKRVYATTASLLAEARKIAPNLISFDQEVTDIRKEYSNRPLMQQTFTRHGLP